MEGKRSNKRVLETGKRESCQVGPTPGILIAIERSPRGLLLRRHAGAMLVLVRLAVVVVVMGVGVLPRSPPAAAAAAAAHAAAVAPGGAAGSALGLPAPLLLARGGPPAAVAPVAAAVVLVRGRGGRCNQLQEMEALEKEGRGSGKKSGAEKRTEAEWTLFMCGGLFGWEDGPTSE